MKCNCHLRVTKERIKLLSGLSRPVTRRTRSSGDDLSFITSVLSVTIFVFAGILTIYKLFFKAICYFLYYLLIKIICFVSRSMYKLCCRPINSVQPVHDFAILGTVDSHAVHHLASFPKNSKIMYKCKLTLGQRTDFVTRNAGVRGKVTTP